MDQWIALQSNRRGVVITSRHSHLVMGCVSFLHRWYYWWVSDRHLGWTNGQVRDIKRWSIHYLSGSLILFYFVILRKGALLFNNVFAIIGGLLEGFTKTANSYEMLIAGRLFIGINCGLNGGLAPMYLSEISPVHLRGAVSHINTFFFSFLLLSRITFTSWKFRFMV